MLKALVLKELREVALVAAIGLAVFFYFLALAVGYQIPAWSHHGVVDVPFVTDDFVYEATVISFCLAVALGFVQSYAESLRGTWVWLLHRPASRAKIVAVKLLVGLAVYLVCAGLPIACYAFWAATPGKHAGPFYWSMTSDAWKNWFWMVPTYLGGFLSGVYPGRWFAARLLPMLGVGILTVILAVFEQSAPVGRPWAWAGMALLIVATVCAIQFVARSRDFS